MNSKFIGKSILFIIVVLLFKTSNCQVFNPEIKTKTINLQYLVRSGHKYAFVDIDGDGDLDIISSSYGPITKLTLQLNIGTKFNPVYEKKTTNAFQLGHIWFPSVVDIDGDGDLDILAFTTNLPSMGYGIAKNIGTPTSPKFDPFSPFKCGLHENLFYADFADIDGDDDLDMFGIVCQPLSLSYYKYRMAFQKNIGTPTEPLFSDVVYDAFGLLYEKFNCIEKYTQFPAFADIDNDGDYDAYFNGKYTSSGGLILYGNVIQINMGNKDSAIFAEPQNGVFGIHKSRYSGMTFTDIDGDGDMDAIGLFGGKVFIQENWAIR